MMDITWRTIYFTWIRVVLSYNSICYSQIISRDQFVPMRCPHSMGKPSIQERLPRIQLHETDGGRDKINKFLGKLNTTWNQYFGINIKKISVKTLKYLKTIHNFFFNPRDAVNKVFFYIFIIKNTYIQKMVSIFLNITINRIRS